MAIVNKNLFGNAVDGVNSIMFEYDNLTTLSDLLTVIGNFITARGWLIHDDNTGGTNFNVYKSLNADGETYKYLGIDLDTADRLLMKVWESWDNVNHTGINLCYNSDNATYAQRIDLVNGGKFRIIATQFSIVIQSETGDGLGSGYKDNDITMIVEYDRMMPNDTPATGYTSFAWINTGLFSGATVSDRYQISYPRVRDGIYPTVPYIDNIAMCFFDIWGKNVIKIKDQANSRAGSNNWNNLPYVDNLMMCEQGIHPRGIGHGFCIGEAQQFGNADKITLNSDVKFNIVTSGGTSKDFYCFKTSDGAYVSAFLFPL